VRKGILLTGYLGVAAKRNVEVLSRFVCWALILVYQDLSTRSDLEVGMVVSPLAELAGNLALSFSFYLILLIRRFSCREVCNFFCHHSALFAYCFFYLITLLKEQGTGVS